MTLFLLTARPAVAGALGKVIKLLTGNPVADGALVPLSGTGATIVIDQRLAPGRRALAFLHLLAKPCGVSAVPFDGIHIVPLFARLGPLFATKKTACTATLRELSAALGIGDDQDSVRAGDSPVAWRAACFPLVIAELRGTLHRYRGRLFRSFNEPNAPDGEISEQFAADLRKAALDRRDASELRRYTAGLTVGQPPELDVQYPELRTLLLELDDALQQALKLLGGFDVSLAGRSPAELANRRAELHRLMLAAGSRVQNGLVRLESSIFLYTQKCDDVATAVR